MMRPNLGGRHLSAPSPFQVLAREVLAGVLIVLIAAVAGAVGGFIMEVF